MKRFIRYNTGGEILSFILSNDKTLFDDKLLEVNDKTLKKVEKDIKKYEVKDGEVVKRQIC